jgi:hypothetical protein
MPSQVDLDGTVLPARSGSSSSDGGGEDSGGDAHMETDSGPPLPPKGPIVDADGFELVQRRRPGRPVARA